jgi:hypothetical protein
MTTTRGWSRVWDYEGQERYIPNRMLQRIEFPWGINEDITKSATGVSLPLRFFSQDTTRKGGCLFVVDKVVIKITIIGEDDEDEDEEDGVNFIVDYEINIDSVLKTQENVGAGRRSRGDTLTHC